eukprot:gene27071-biopygen17630
MWRDDAVYGLSVWRDVALRRKERPFRKKCSSRR